MHEATCPICRQISLEDFLGFFHAKLEVPILPGVFDCVYFVALVFSYSPQEGKKLILSDKEVNIIDCLNDTVCSKSNNIVLEFFAPKVLLPWI